MNLTIFTEHVAILWAVTQQLRKMYLLAKLPYIGVAFRWISDQANSIDPRAFTFVVGIVLYALLVFSGQADLSSSEILRTLGVILSSQIVHDKVAQPIGL